MSAGEFVDVDENKLELILQDSALRDELGRFMTILRSMNVWIIMIIKVLELELVQKELNQIISFIKNKNIKEKI